ncbi:hypothetical protein BDV29DRAFT_176044 [Aspergillus leporis]|uniref:Uncharacterized protein n=1 Tax=Aspergillus leporis TaxID=41062 RepID=A0A5N5WZE7_9EURO|nr:hypothetical protein BDV29DRAFT_176044 [Aspergillus leporis]
MVATLYSYPGPYLWLLEPSCLMCVPVESVFQCGLVPPSLTEPPLPRLCPPWLLSWCGRNICTASHPRVRTFNNGALCLRIFPPLFPSLFLLLLAVGGRAPGLDHYPMPPEHHLRVEIARPQLRVLCHLWQLDPPSLKRHLSPLRTGRECALKHNRGHSGGAQILPVL